MGRLRNIIEVVVVVSEHERRGWGWESEKIFYDYHFYQQQQQKKTNLCGEWGNGGMGGSVSNNLGVKRSL